MKTRPRILVALICLLSIAIVIPPDIASQAGQRAGQVSRAIPAVLIARGSQQLPAAPKSLVDWGDVVHTDDGGRARIALDDGSLLNLGASSSLTVTQHNPGAQQTQLELTYGRLRSQVVKQAKPNAKFDVHTPVGVAGVVGTDFFLSYLNGLFQVIVFEGHIKFCNLDGQCVEVMAGQISTIRDAHQPPDPPTTATPSELIDAANATSIGLVARERAAHHVSAATIIGLTVLIAIPAIVIPLATNGRPAPQPGLVFTNPNPPGQGACPPGSPNC